MNNEQQNWQKFYYHYWNKDKVEKDTFQRLTLSESLNVIGVLTYYGVDIKIKSGDIFIPDALFHDTMFIYSISQKSLDSSWLSTHVWVK
ncbi:MAG: hypothetical protein IT262_05620 [Saprospiraceae bacterium]|nr:hypothetical protein [Saprospiraceae bacterium]